MSFMRFLMNGIELDKRVVLSVIRGLLKNQIRSDKEYWIEHISKRAKIAEKLAVKHWNCVDNNHASLIYWKDESWLFGALFDIFSISSIKLEQVIEISSTDVAEIIVKSSVDNRLPLSKREKNVLGSLYGVSETLYYAFLADIICTIRNYRRNFVNDKDKLDLAQLQQEFKIYKMRFTYIKKRLSHVLCLDKLFDSLNKDLELFLSGRVFVAAE